MGKGKARIQDDSLYLQAGIDPKTKQPIGNVSIGHKLKAVIKNQLKVVDEQDAVNRYVWYNLPGDMSGQELERLLYYKGQLAFFYSEELDQFFFMPYALDGGIDFYGRYRRIHPIPYAEGFSDEHDKRLEEQRVILSNIKLDVLYEIPIEPVDITKCCVLLHDYTKGLAQTITPRVTLQDGLLDVMSNMIPYMDTALALATGVTAIRVPNQDQESNVAAFAMKLKDAALSGRAFIPTVGELDFQVLTEGPVYKGEEFMLAMQSLDNYRLSLYGLDNGGLFQKKSHMLEAEEEVNQGNVGLIYQDGLSIRQRFCDIVNSITGLGIYCEPSENVIGNDMNMDGYVGDETDQSGELIGDQGGVYNE